MQEVDPLVLSYSHLANFPRAADALHTLKKVASLVKPLMRARGWRVAQLTEFYPAQQNLLGLNVNRGEKICLRLRYPGDRNQFLPLEQVADTMLHELAHNVHGPHDAKFHALWNQLRDEHLSLTMKGYTGEGFLSEGHRLGGRTMPMDEARRVARAAAERRRTLNHPGSSSGFGRRLGGSAPRPGEDMRQVITHAAEQRNRTLRGCANDNQSRNEIEEIANTATRNGFRTKAEEDAANDAAIAQALWEIVQEEEMAKKGPDYIPPSPFAGSRSSNSSTHYRATPPPHNARKPNTTTTTTTTAAAATSSFAPQRSIPGPGESWTCGVCTLNNPANYLCCGACATEKTKAAPILHGQQQQQQQKQQQKQQQQQQKTVIDLTGSEEQRPKKRVQFSSTSTSTSTSANPAAKASTSRQAEKRPAAVPVSRAWTCHFCGRVRESQWWSCDLCGTVKLSS